MSQAQQSLVERNLGLVRMAVRRTRAKWQAAGIEAEDAYMIGCEGLSRAALLYDPAKGAESTYLYTSALRTILRECDKQAHPCTELLSLDEPQFVHRLGGTVTLLDMLPAKDSTENTAVFRTALADALATMTELERTCFRLWCDGWKQREIARRMGCAPSNVNYALRQAKGKFKRQWERAE